MNQLAFFDNNLNLVVEPGMIEVMVRSLSEDIRLKGKFEIIVKKDCVEGMSIFVL